jgi:hypothetical protein
MKLAQSRRLLFKNTPHNKGKVKVGHAFYPQEYRKNTLAVLLSTMLLCGAFSLLGSYMDFDRSMTSSFVIRASEVKVIEVVEKEVSAENVDTWIGQAVDEFLPTHTSEARMIMHCLAHREAGHRATTTRKQFVQQHGQ